MLRIADLLLICRPGAFSAGGLAGLAPTDGILYSKWHSGSSSEMACKDSYYLDML